MKKFLIAAITAFSFIFSGTANADYPNGPVQFLIPWPVSYTHLTLPTNA